MLKPQLLRPVAPDNPEILREAVRRALESGLLSAEYALNTPQIEALKGYLDFLSTASHPRRAYADMATGTGKTGLFGTVIRHLYRILDERGLRDEFKTIIVEPTLPLLKQTHDSLLAIGPELAPLIGVYGGSAKQLDTPISILTYNSWVDLLESGRLEGGRIGFHVTDEAHYALSERRQDLFSSALADTMHFGVTATAQYDLTKSLERTHENQIYKLGLREAIERGFLADYVHVQYAVMRLLPASASSDGVELGNGEYNLLKRVEWARLVAHAYSSLQDTVSGQELSDKVGIVFAADTKHADFIANMLNKNPALREKAQRIRGWPIHGRCG